MAMNRRNVLIGLGTVAAGGGAALGTGAFSSVEADRTVTVETVGDDSAFVGISPDGEYAVNTGSDEAVVLDLGNSGDDDGFNDDAETVIDGILTLENNAADGSDTNVGFDDGSSITDSITLIVDENSGTVESEVVFTLNNTNSSSDSYTLSDGDTVDVNATVRTGSRTDESATNNDQSEATLTILAQ